MNTPTPENRMKPDIRVPYKEAPCRWPQKPPVCGGWACIADHLLVLQGRHHPQRRYP